MLPVSGAAQLSASGAMWLRPVISASGAYSRFVSPAPKRSSGQEQVPQAALAGLGLQLLHHGRVEVRVARTPRPARCQTALGRIDVLVHELEQRSP